MNDPAIYRPLRSFCSPFWRPLRSVCGLQTTEQPRTRANTLPDVQRFREYSPVFAAVRGSLRQSGRTVRVGFLMRFSERLRSHLRSSYRVHTALLARRDPMYAIPHAHMLLRGDGCPRCA